MKAIIITLMIVVSLFANKHEVRNFESVDLNNHGGPTITHSTDIIQVELTEYYLSLRGFDSEGKQVGESYSVTNYVTNGVDATFDLGETLKGCYVFNEKLIIIDISNDKITIYMF